MIPPELQNIRYQMVENGLFQVFENGRVFRHRPNKVSEPKISLSNGYKVVSATLGRKQSNYYIHRLMAMAFIPNPENKQFVIFKDGDQSNTSLGNLMWASNSERAIMTSKGRDVHRNAPNCKKCGTRTRCKGEICQECRRKVSQELITHKRIRRVSEVNLSLITSEQRRAVEMRLKGKELKEIAGTLGTTSHYVNNLIQNARKRSERAEARLARRR